MSDRGEDDHDLRAIRKTREVEQGLRQFLKIETGLGKSAAYRRGHIFAFEFTQEQKDRVEELMIGGMTFEDAFDKVRYS